MLLEVFILLLIVLFSLHWWAHNYWKRKNVFSVPSEIFFGNIKNLLFEKISVITMFNDIYKKHKEHRLIGFYCFYNPMLFVADPEIIKRVLVTDFKSFANTGFDMDMAEDPIMALNPFTAKNMVSWKELRGLQSQFQTPLKLKESMSSMVKVADIMTEYIKKQLNQPIIAMDLVTRLTVGAAVLSGFGLEPNTFTDPEFGFIKHASGEKLWSPTRMSIFASFFAPLLSKLFSLRLVSKEAEEYFVSVINTNIEYRNNSQIYRGDLIDAVVKYYKKKSEMNNEANTSLEIAAHCATFYLDASVTSAFVLCFLMLELVDHLDIQEKLRQEILSVGKKLEDFELDKIHSLEYLQMVLDECLRLHAPVTTIARTCTEDITIEGVKIPKGMKVFLSPYALHHDPEYYPEPDEFKPERFSEENKQLMAKYTFLPFGEGPRICVGMKYGILLVKVAIISILLKYRILSINGALGSKHDPTAMMFQNPNPDATIKFEEI